MARYSALSRVPPPTQLQPLDKRQVENNAGGYTYKLDPLEQARRWLILGSDKNAYYQTTQALSIENSSVIVALWRDNPHGLADLIVEVSTNFLAPKQDPAIFALALGMCAKDVHARRKAASCVVDVCRTGTHLFKWVDECKQLGRGWGALMRKTVALWLAHKPLYQLGYQMIKYRKRQDWAWGDLIVKAHPFTVDQSRHSLFNWALSARGLNKKGPGTSRCHYDVEELPDIVRAHIDAIEPRRESENESLWKRRVLHYVREYNLPWEALPTEANAWPELWAELAPKTGLTAVLRNLGRMTQMGVIAPLSDTERVVAERLESTDELTRAKIHPFNLLMAFYVYRSGISIQGSSCWRPSSRILRALDRAFDMSFAALVPTGKRRLIALDVSGSMYSMSPIMQTTRRGLVPTPMYAGDAAACMALVTMRCEENWHCTAFADTFRELKVSGEESLDGMMKAMKAVSMGGTDCSLPMIWAKKNKIPVDSFEIMTDNETWAGFVHPMEALRYYRDAMGIDAKLVTVGMTSTGFSIADPEDSGCMDIVGFDRSAPAVMADFVRGTNDGASAESADEEGDE